MLSLTKKSDAQPVAAPLWHANFRDFERLPDTKVVRTTFFINTAAIALAIGMLLWVGYREYSGYNLKEQIADATRQIEGNRKQNAEALKLSAAFAEEEKKLAEAVAFMKVPIRPIEFINLIGDTLPKNISIDYADMRINDPKNSVFQIRGRVAGSPDQASGITSSYVDILRADERLGDVFDPIVLNRLDRDSSGDFMLFEITLTVKPEKKI
jgi:hypothetical protein